MQENEEKYDTPDQKQGEILKYKPWEDQPKAKKEKFRHPI